MISVRHLEAWLEANGYGKAVRGWREYLYREYYRHEEE